MPARRRRIVRSRAQGERLLALELAGTIAVKVLYGFKQGGLVGPSAYIPPLAAYGILALVVSWDEAVEVAVIIGALIFLATLMARTAENTLVGADVTSALADASDQAAQGPAKYVGPWGGGK